MKKLNILLALLIMIVIATSINALEECSVTINQNNITIHDFIEPDGVDSDCITTLRQNEVIIDRKNMTQDELFYNASFYNLGFAGEYTAFINCNNSEDVYYSECNFLLDEDMLKSFDCPDNDIPSIIMFIFIFIVLIVVYVFARLIVKFPVVEIMIGIGFLIYSVSLLGCNQLIGAIGILSSIAMMLVAVLGR